MEKKDFDQLVALALKQPGRNVMKPVVEKEILHYDIFHAMDKANLLKNLVFQGGTSLRLCRGSNRFSEDLDFAGGRDFTSDAMHEIKTCVEKHIGQRYGLTVEVKEPKNTPFNAVKVDKWQVTVETSPAQRDLPRQRIKIEIANVPAYTRELVPLRSNYDFFQGYDSVLVNTESLSEVMADKVRAFPVAKAIRHRDLWDLAWLSQQNAKLDPKLVDLKITDYQVEGYASLLDSAIERLPAIVVGKEFIDQMSRFIDAQILEKTLHQADFLNYLTTTVTGIFKTMKEHLEPMSKDDTPSFRM